MRTPHPLLILSFAFFCQVASATTHFIQVGQGGGNNFAPNFVIIYPGDTVQWDWVTGVHSVTSGTPGNPDGIFDSGISGTPNTFSFTFNTPANYPFYCNVHGAMMTGTVSVAVVDPPTPTVGPTATATATATPTASPTSTPPASPTPAPSVTPTPSPSPCGWSSAAMFPIPILRAAVTSLNGSLYTFGGRSNGQYISASYKFDGTSWTSIAPMPAALGGSMAASDGTFIYILGGVSDSPFPVNTMYRYNPATNTYTTMAPFFVEVADGAAVYLAGKIYKIFGETVSASTNTLEIYNIATNTWTFGASPSPDGRAASFGFFVQGNYIYVAGGSFPGSSPTNKTYRYDSVTNTWDDAAIADLPVARYGAASAFHFGGGVLAGGYVGNSLSPINSASTIRWDPNSNTWTDLPDLPEARALTGGAVLSGNFHIVGGGTLGVPALGTNDHLKFPPCLPTPVPTPTPTPTPTGTPGPNGKIAFSSDRDGNFEIYVMDPDGSHVIRLTDSAGFDSSPVWSPDGTKIAFATSRNVNSELYVMNPDGSGLTNLTNHPADDVWPTWSPDGTKIAFTSIRTPPDDGDIYIMNADGSNQTRVTNNLSRDFVPAWSPDGTKIAFCTDRHDPSGFDLEIYVMDIDGTNQVRLTNDLGSDIWPAWSPDGAKIAFASNRSGHGIFVMNADGSNPTRLTTSSAGAEYPAWSPDGTKIVSTSYSVGNEELTVINADGTNPINLTNNTAYDISPSWQRRPTSTPAPAQALNISTRMRVETGDNVLIGGFIVTGTAPKSVAVRGIGPSLGQFGLGDFLADPTIELRDAAGALLHQNDNWQDDPEKASQLIALGLAPKDLNESGLVATLSPGAYTAILAGTNAGAGVGLVEFYDVNPTADSHLANISTRGFVRTGDNVMIGGFILGGDNSTHVVVRGIGPSLAQFGLNPVLADPTVEVHDGNGALLVSNDNWQDNAVSASHLTAFGLAPQSAVESGIYVGLPPGAFTAILAGKDGGTGIGLVEIYNVP